MKKHTRKQYARWILLVEAVGGLSGWLTHKGSAPIRRPSSSRLSPLPARCSP